MAVLTMIDPHYRGHRQRLRERFIRSGFEGFSEVFEVAYLDTGYRLLRDGVDRLEEGTIDRATVYPGRVVEHALKRGAAALVGVLPGREIRLAIQAKLLYTYLYT